MCSTERSERRSVTITDGAVHVATYATPRERSIAIADAFIAVAGGSVLHV